MQWGRQFRRVLRSTVVVIGGLVALLIVATALFANSLAPNPPDEQNFDLVESSQDQWRSPRRALGRQDGRARAGAEAGRHLRLGADDRGDGPRSAARPGVLTEPALADDVQPARPLRRRDEPRAGAGRVLADQPGPAHVDLQAPAGRDLPRRPA